MAEEGGAEEGGGWGTGSREAEVEGGECEVGSGEMMVTPMGL